MATKKNLYTYPFKAMGSPCKLELLSELSRAEIDTKAALVIDEVLRLEKKYSRYLDDSVTSQINAAAGSDVGISVDDETAALLDYAQIAFVESQGLFDISSGVLRRLWHFDSDQLPAASDIQALLPAVGWQNVKWQTPRIALPNGDMELDFGGYVKEYGVDCAAKLCRSLGLSEGIVDLGGDIALIGTNEKRPWIIGIRNPAQPETAIAKIPLHSGALASSGDYERFMVVNGKRYSHILNPKTGWPVTCFASVSVVADQCLVAGTASTIAMLKGEAQGREFLEELGLPFLIIDHKGRIEGTLQTDTTTGTD